MSDGFKVTKGLKQGCCLSPPLFNVYLEQVLKVWKKKCKGMGIPIARDTTMFTICCAGDQIVTVQDTEDLEQMSRKVIEEYEKGD